MKVIIISAPDTVENEASIINELFASGLDCFHLRKPLWGTKQIAELVLQIKPEFYDRIAWHQSHQTAMAFDAKRLHFKEEDRKKLKSEDLRILQESDYILSTSVHHTEDAQELSGFDYVLFGPVFDSISKTGYKGVFNDGEMMLHKENKRHKIYAIGGVNHQNISEVKNMGFDGVALLGTIWQNPGKETYNYLKIKEKCSNDLVY